MRNFLLAIAASTLLLSACTTAGPDGKITLKQRGDGPNDYSIWADGSGALTSAPKGRDGYCNPTNKSECGGKFDKAMIEKAAAEGNLQFVGRDGKISPYQK